MRDRRPGPPPLRSDTALWGLDNIINAADRQKVKEGNIRTKFSLRVFRLCKRLNIAVSIENPYSSRIWKLPAIQRMLRSLGVSFGYSDFCQDAKPWRNRTGFLVAGYSLDFTRQCHSNGKLCSRTNKVHNVLEGKNENGQFWTRIAKKYPRRLCKRWASVISNWVGSNWITRVSSLWTA